MEPKVSIIIPVYNGSNYLREAIDSALNQTYNNIEIIVINDGSNDEGSTREIALSYGERIRYFEKENGGVASALNLGIKLMNGEYFSWLSHDDIYLPQKIEKEIQELKRAGDMYSPVNCGWTIFSMTDGSCIDKLSSTGIYDYSYYESGILSVLMGLIDGCALLFHKSLFDKYGLFDEKLLTSQDYAKWFEMFRDKKIVYIDETLAKYRVHVNQTSALDSDFMKNSEDLHEWIATKLNEADSLSAGMDYYTLLGVAMVRFSNFGFRNAANIVAKKLCKLDEPEYGSVKRSELKNCILGESDTIYIYCMGNRGKSLLNALALRGITVTGFSDGNEEKCKQTIGGVKGRLLSDIPKESRLIVSKENPGSVIDSLKTKGYTNIIAFEDIEQMVMETTIDKSELIKLYAAGE